MRARKYKEHVLACMCERIACMRVYVCACACSRPGACAGGRGRGGCASRDSNTPGGTDRLARAQTLQKTLECTKPSLHESHEGHEGLAGQTTCRSATKPTARCMHHDAGHTRDRSACGRCENNGCSARLVSSLPCVRDEVSRTKCYVSCHKRLGYRVWGLELSASNLVLCVRTGSKVEESGQGGISPTPPFSLNDLVWTRRRQPRKT